MSSVDNAILAGQRIRNRLKSISAFAHVALSDLSKHSGFLARFENARSLFDEFNKISSQITYNKSDKTEELDSLDELTTEIDDLFYTVNSVYLEVTKSPSNHETPRTNIRLPTIELPTFGGSQREWPTFFALFKELIHENKSLSNIERFHYLISTLSKEPLNLIQTLPITEANYTVAYDSLVKRYENRRVLATQYWNAIVHAQPLTSESAHALRKLNNTISENLAALANYKLDFWDFTLFNITLEKLDADTRKRFELEHANLEIPSYADLESYILKQCKVLEASAYLSREPNKPRIGNSQKPNKLLSSQFKFTPKSYSSPSSLLINTNSNVNRSLCLYCNDNHTLYKCPDFLSKTPSDRFSFVKSNNLCINCLGALHKLKKCASLSTCQKCRLRHHTLLHFEEPHFETPVPPSTKASQPSHDVENTIIPSTVNTLTNTAQNISHFSVLLATVLIEIRDKFGNLQTIRALLDGASQASFISENTLQRLGLPLSARNVSICGLNETCSESRGLTTCVVTPIGHTQPSFNIDAIVIPKICATMPSVTIPIQEWNHLENLKLADPQFNVPGPIDMLLGAEIFPLILKDGRLVGNTKRPTALNTVFGWVLMGKVGLKQVRKLTSLCTSISTSSIDQTLKKFWELEQVPEIPTMSKDDKRCEDIFRNLHSRNGTGRYVVPLPFNDIDITLGDSYVVALRRLLSLERRLDRNVSLRDSYITFMKDYLDAGHMDPVDESIRSESYLIPHHAVMNSFSTTTKFRVVFDASAKTDTGTSLNDLLYTGPKLQNDLCQILLNFRLPAVVFTADIRQMYRQILVLPAHRKYQHILWRFSPNEAIREYELNTVTYGLSSAPYLAMRTIRQLVEDEGLNFPGAARVLKTDIYVDDIVTGTASVESALSVQQELITMLHKAGFELRKWSSNHPSLLDLIPEDYRQTCLAFDDKDSTIKILGLRWLPSTDRFYYNIDTLSERPCTKRNILSELSRIFDPLGFLSPITFLGKHLMQHLWTLRIDWDAIPPDEIIQKWRKFRLELPYLRSFQIDRFISSKSCEIHGFCDASQRGYAAVVYVRTILDTNKIKTHLVMAKSKVAPLKQLSVPRLELCAALLLADVLHIIVETYSKGMNVQGTYAWTDSMIALHWIRSSSYEWKTFVSNRVSKIHDRTDSSIWNHVGTSENPADCASRGLLPGEFISNQLWLHGPLWLKRSKDNWPISPIQSQPCREVLSEKRVTVLLCENPDRCSLWSLLHRFSSLQKILRIIAYCFRFYKRTRFKTHEFAVAFTDVELHQMQLILIRIVQFWEFGEDIAKLKRKQLCSKPLRSLCPFLDEEGLLRVGGRLTLANIDSNAKYPLLLPRKHRLTTLIIEDCHVRNLHPGMRTTQYLLLQNYYILSAKRAIRACLSKCIRCFRLNPKPCIPLMGNLPLPRLTQAKPFHYVGVDFGGPFNILMSKTRGSKTTKAYLCLFVCYATKALHVELVSDLSAEAFLAALRRFIARRGRCICLHSDCGTNFVGAYRMLNDLMRTSADAEYIKWKFNPPSSPHFGGLWEAGIKSVKTHLSRIIGNQILTYEEFYTVLVQVEALLNSRPLCALSNDPNDLTALTPGHFLSLEPLCAAPDPDLSHMSMNRLNRWQLLQRFQQDFWKRWHLEYLHTLQQRQKWIKPDRGIQLNQVVVLKQESPPLRWPLGRIVTLHPGADGIVRVVTIKTASGLYKRAVTKVCPLPEY